MLLYLARRPGTVVTKQELLTEIWNQPFGGTEKTVDTHLSWLRAKLGESASAPRYSAHGTRRRYQARRTELTQRPCVASSS